MQQCWVEDPSSRPDFSVICARIEEFRHSPVGEDYYTGGAIDRDADEYDDTYDDAH